MPFERDKLLRARTWKRVYARPTTTVKFYERPWTPTESFVDRSRTSASNTRIVNRRQVDSCSDSRNAKPNRITRKGKVARKERETVPLHSRFWGFRWGRSEASSSIFVSLTMRVYSKTRIITKFSNFFIKIKEKRMKKEFEMLTKRIITASFIPRYSIIFIYRENLPSLVNDRSQRGDRIEIFPVANGQKQRHHLADHRQTPWAKVNS